MDVKLVQLQSHGDDRGSLAALEEERNIPFAIKRVYYLFDTKNGVRRGFHAHRALEQMSVVVRGSCKILLDDGESKDVIELNSPSTGLLLEPMIWHEMFDFSEDCIFMVLANHHYDEDDYIRNYEEFLKMVHG